MHSHKVQRVYGARLVAGLGKGVLAPVVRLTQAHVGAHPAQQQGRSA